MNTVIPNHKKILASTTVCSFIRCFVETGLIKMALMNTSGQYYYQSMSAVATSWY